MAVATFAAGCFWGVEELYRKLDGVYATAVGYIGGQTDKPSYKEVCADDTGHAEAVQIHYNPEEVSFETLMNLFWENHNPTTLNRQGPDVGSQYRSAVFYHTDEQKSFAQSSKEQLTKVVNGPSLLLQRLLRPPFTGLKSIIKVLI